MCELRRIDRQPPANAAVFTTLYEAAHLLVALTLAAYPWLLACAIVDPAPSHRLFWLGAIGVQALCLIARPVQSWVLKILTLTLLAGLCLIQAGVVYNNIVTSAVAQDYFLIASWLSASSHTLLTAPVALAENYQFSYMQYYFDPITPLINRITHLTNHPFRMLGFHLAALLSAPIVTWVILSQSKNLTPFQALLPVSLMMHPSLMYTIQADYHTSGIGISPLLIGTYLFWSSSSKSAFATLLLGTFTKVSYWPSWMMFAVIHGWKRQWRWMAIYTAVGLSAISTYRLIQTSHGIDSILGNLGLAKTVTMTLPEMISSLLTRPIYIRETSIIFLWFVIFMLLPFGFTMFRRPITLVPILPLVALSILDQLSFRSIMFNVYAVEYLGFITAAIIVGLNGSRRRVQAMMSIAITLGLLLSNSNPYQWIAWNPEESYARHLFDRERFYSTHFYRDGLRSRWPNTLAALDRYTQAVAFSECAIGDASVIVTTYQWASYVRGSWDRVWVLEGDRPLNSSVWENTETLVYAANPRAQGSLTYFPDIPAGFDKSRLGLLMLKLPVTVSTKESMYEWRYLGGQRLADCAVRYGYNTEPTVAGETWLHR